MRPVAKRRIGAGLALAQCGGACFICREFERCDVAARVGAVTKWLALGFATTAPIVVFASFQFSFRGKFRGNDWDTLIGHRLLAP